MPRPTVNSSQNSEGEPPVSVQFNELRAFISSENVKLQQQNEGLQQSVDSLRDDIQLLRESAAQNQQDIQTIQTATNTNSKEILKLKIINNDLEQRERSRTVRFFDLPNTVRDGFDTAKIIYTDILQPAFVRAHQDSVIEDVPALLQAVEYAHPLSSPPPRPPGSPPVRPVIILRFTSRFYKNTFLRYKKRVLEDFNRQRGCTARVYQDLTKINLSAINRLKLLPDVHSVFYSGHLKLCTSSDPDRTQRVLNPFAESLQDALTSP